MADVIQFWEMQMSTHRTGKYNHEMGGTILCKTVKEKYLGVTMNANKFRKFRTMQNSSV